MPDSFAVLRSVLSPAIRWAWRGRIVGLEHVPVQGSVLVAANHASYVDFLLLSAVLPRRITFLAKQKLFDDVRWRWLMRATGQIRVGGGRSAREACMQLRRLISEGRLLGIFPEGTRTPGVHPGRFHDTVIKLSLRHDIPVLPVRLIGTREAWAPGAKLPQRVPCDVVIGEAYFPGRDIAVETSALRERIMGLGHDK